MPDSTLNSNKTEYSAFEIYTKYGGLIRSIIFSRVKDEDRAQDIFQDMFLQLVANPIKTDVEDIEKYLCVATSNCVSDNLRRAISYRQRMRVYANKAENPDRHYVPNDPVIESEDMAKIRKLMHTQLQKREAEAITLCYVEGNNIEEIAGKMKKSKQAVSRFISGGLTKIRDTVAFHGGIL